MSKWTRRAELILAVGLPVLAVLVMLVTMALRRVSGL
jgi:hypothetical protein